MRIVALAGLAILAVTCGPDPNAKLPFTVVSNGGTAQPGTGGTSTGGTTTVGTGGRNTVGSGGETVTGSGGRTVGSGGRGAGGVTGSGGRTTADAGVDARVNRDTASGSGGSTVVGSGGRIGSGGSSGRDAGAGGAGSGGITGSGGATVPRDATGGSDVASGCVTAVVDNGYVCGSATSCAECKDNNNNPREDGCKAGIDCLAKAGPSCNASCQQNCWNLGGDQYGIDCVKALQTAACSGSGC